MQFLCVGLYGVSMMMWDARSERLREVGATLFWIGVGGMILSSKRPTDWTLVYVLINCAVWGFVIAIVLEIYGPEHRDDPVVLAFLVLFMAAAFLPFIALPLIRRWRR
jgi:hypothetical protein